MSRLYETIALLCAEKGIKPGRMCSEIGISRGNIGNLKMGRIESLSAESLSKIASYFGVSVDYLLGAEKAPTQSGERKAGDEELKAAFWGGDKDLSPEDINALWDDAKAYIQFKTQQRKGEK